MVPAWPIVLLLNVWFTLVGPLLFGPYILADEFELKGVRNQVRKGAHRSGLFEEGEGSVFSAVTPDAHLRGRGGHPIEMTRLEAGFREKVGEAALAS